MCDAQRRPADGAPAAHVVRDAGVDSVPPAKDSSEGPRSRLRLRLRRRRLRLRSRCQLRRPTPHGRSPIPPGGRGRAPSRIFGRAVRVRARPFRHPPSPSIAEAGPGRVARPSTGQPGPSGSDGPELRQARELVRGVAVRAGEPGELGRLPGPAVVHRLPGPARRRGARARGRVRRQPPGVGGGMRRRAGVGAGH